MPYVTQAAVMNGAGVNSNRPLTSCPMGLVSNGQSTAESTQPTSGVAMGIGSQSFPVTMEINGNVVRIPESVAAGVAFRNIGGFCIVQGLAAGTYDIGVQFKATSGTVFASQRKLGIWVVGF